MSRKLKAKSIAPKSVPPPLARSIRSRVGSNLKPAVLRKNLFRLGLALDTFEAVEGQINRLLSSRNKIVHGESKSGVSLKFYEELRDAVYSVMQNITMEVTKAIIERKFLRTAAAPAAN